MTTEIGSLAVSLSMDASSFNGSINQMNRHLSSMGSELRAAKALGADYGKSVEGLTSKKEILTRSVATSSVKLTEERRKYDELVASGTANEATLERQARRVNEAQTQYNRLTTELNEVTEELRIQSSAWTQAGERMEAAGNKMKAIGDGMTNVGKKMSMAITAPIVAAGTASVKMAADFEAQMDRVGAIAGATAGEMDALNESALRLGADTSKSASEVAVAMEDMAAMGFNAVEIMGAMPGVISASEASGESLALAAQTVAAALNVWGLEASEASRVADVLAMAANTSAAGIDDMQLAFKYAGAPAAALGIQLEEVAAAIGIMTDSGLDGSNAGTALRASLLALNNPAKAQEKIMKQLGFSLTDSSGEAKSLSGIVGDLAKSLEGETEAQKVATLAKLVGTEAVSGFLALIKAGPTEIDKMTTALENSGGASAETAAKMKDNLNGALEELGGTIETAAITIGNKLIPSLRKGAEYIQGMVDKFNALSPEAQKNILVMAGVAAAIGPVLVIGGTLVSSIGSIITAAGAMAGAIGVAGGATATFGGALAVITGPIGLTVAAVAGLGVAVALVAKDLREDAIPEVDRFGESVSESTQKALGSYFELSDGVSQSMANLSITSGTVTEELKNSMIAQFEEMNTQILAGMEQRHAEQIESTRNFFANSSVLTDEMEARILERQVNSSEQQKTEQQERENRIKEIIETAYKEKRELTMVEEAAINGIKEEMNRAAVKNLSDSEIEQKIILERMALTAGDLSARQAAEVTKNSAEQRDKTVKAAEEQYNQTLAQIIRLRDESHDISKDQANKMIAEAGKSRDSTVAHASGMHAEVVSEAKKQAQGHVKEVDWETGQIKSKWGVLWGDLKKGWNSYTSYLTGTNMKQIGVDLMSGLKSGIDSMGASIIKSAKTTAGWVTKTFKKELQIKSPSRVMMAIGRNVSEGLAVGIKDKENEVIARASQVSKSLIASAKNVLSKGTKETNAEISVINKKANEEAKKIEKRANEDIHQIKKTAKEKKRKLTSAELLKIQRLEQDSSAKVKKINEKAASDVAKINSKTGKERLDALKLFVEEKKQMEQLSLVDEVKIWESSVSAFKNGTKEKVEAQKAYQKALIAVNDEITSTNKEYSDKMVAINNDLQKSEQDLTDKYNSTLNSRISSLRSFSGLFDEFTYNMEKSGSELLMNLSSQVEGFRTWQTEMDKFASKRVDSGLIEELREMGPKALPELLALNSLTDEHLTIYSNLYKDKTALARTQAEKELSGMKKDTEATITELRKTANTELEKLRVEWVNKIKSITKASDGELLSLKQIGVNAGKGLLDGLASMEPALIAKSKSIANSIQAAMKAALQVKSPSRVTMGIGKHIGEGLIIGMEQMNAMVENTASKLAQFATPSVDDQSYGASVNRSNRSGVLPQNDRPIVINVISHLDGQEVARNQVGYINGMQYDSTSISALLKGVSL
ncbi:phage tail tape measure protein [Psychrobacillus sp. FSL H8-0510]|uniref:phage tail tape measure protein n=1 Tax=Psychrobacillus sp. FSL H8-0510 TaxID=2921394 RepID=UPI0030F850EC